MLIFTHANWKEECVLETGLWLVFLFCPELAFCAVIKELIGVVKMMKNDLFEMLLDNFRYAKSANFVNIRAKTMNNSLLKVLFYILMSSLSRIWNTVGGRLFIFALLAFQIFSIGKQIGKSQNCKIGRLNVWQLLVLIQLFCTNFRLTVSVVIPKVSIMSLILFSNVSRDLWCVILNFDIYLPSPNVLLSSASSLFGIICFGKGFIFFFLF